MQRPLHWILAMVTLVAMCVECSPAMAADPYMSDMIKKPAYARALKTLFDHAGNLPSWTREALKPKGNIVETPVTHASIDGKTYELFSECMPHNCDDTALILMFAPSGNQAWGALVDQGHLSYLGAPSDTQAEAMKEALQIKPDN